MQAQQAAQQSIQAFPRAECCLWTHIFLEISPINLHHVEVGLRGPHFVLPDPLRTHCLNVGQATVMSLVSCWGVLWESAATFVVDVAQRDHSHRNCTLSGIHLFSAQIIHLSADSALTTVGAS